ncbi:meiotic nuclear division protein 1 homolog [Plakobranchus ocellatus]|uniref:Meiotic nuclear division protein 1 homolog n=1 Tax=Plakobranchus ocellatus TaxID=259542 RepID=A0AAV4ATQ3_9GAST|nr:meiotic nuclear division protein 1 homolog [Plakobranchus ocellatus]
MSKKKGLSLEEKRSRMTDFFYEKDLEKLCPKEKGITPMSVKEVVNSLVDDGIVDSDKIGTSIYFWAFPSKASQNRKRKIDDLEAKLLEMEKRQQAVSEALSNAKKGKEKSDEREEVLDELNKQQTERARICSEVEKYKECDPEVLEAIKEQTSQAKEAANRWTDNIFATKSWIKSKFAFEESVIDKQFGVPSDFDYIE